MEEKTTKSPLTKAQIKKFKKLEDEANDNTDKTGWYMDEFDYCLGNFAEDLCDAGDKKWARRIYKIVEDKIGGEIDSTDYCSFADNLANNLGDKEWARKIYKEAEEDYNVDKRELASSIINYLGDKEWARKLYVKSHGAALKKDKEVVLAAVKLEGYALEFADASLKKDKEVVLAAVKKDGDALKYADDSLQEDKNVLAAVKKD